MEEEKKKERSPSESLLMLTMMLEGVVFGSLYGWALARVDGVKTPEMKKYLGYGSVLVPLLLIDKDCCKTKLPDLDMALFSLHLVLSIRSYLQRGMSSIGPWVNGEVEENPIFSTVAFLTHYRGFIHLLTKEARY